MQKTVRTTSVISSFKNTELVRTKINKNRSAPHLQHREVGLAWQAEFLLLWRVGVEAMLVQPAPQNLHCLLGQVAAATALPEEPPSWQVEWGAVIAVRHGRGVLLFQSWGRGGGLSVHCYCSTSVVSRFKVHLKRFTAMSSGYLQWCLFVRPHDGWEHICRAGVGTAAHLRWPLQRGV